MAYTITNLKDESDPQGVLAEAVAMFRRRYGSKIIDEGTAKAISEKYKGGEAVIMLVRGDSDKVTGASFSLIHPPKKGDDSPPAAVYTYEAGSKLVRYALLPKTVEAIEKEIGASPVFFEAKATSQEIAEDDKRGFRRIHFDMQGPAGYQWDRDTHYYWMVLGDKPPSEQTLETAIHLQRNFVVLTTEPGEILPHLNMPLAQQVPDTLRGDDERGYGINSAIKRAKEMAEEGRMSLTEKLRPFVYSR